MTEEATLAKPEITIGERYLRRRPFLVVTTFGRPTNNGEQNRAARRATPRALRDDTPSNRARTERAGWTDVPGNVDVFERTVIVDRVSDKMLTEATVIVDLLNTKLVKNRFNDKATDDQVIAYYVNKYSADIQEGIETWTKHLTRAVEKGKIEADEAKNA